MGNKIIQLKRTFAEALLSVAASKNLQNLKEAKKLAQV
jgi:hypothetical protein|tara:strand:+ start:293 stop:406 length:114 start_codon:yes stop_codon:yes gene_type:complete